MKDATVFTDTKAAKTTKKHDFAAENIRQMSEAFVWVDVIHTQIKGCNIQGFSKQSISKTNNAQT